MNAAEISSVILIVTMGFVALFQLALALGAPMGEYAFGGQNPGKLPAAYRAASAVSIFVYLGIAGHQLAQLGVLEKFLPTDLNAVANWAVFGLNALSLIMNSISRSAKERKLWAPVALLMSVTSLIVALG